MAGKSAENGRKLAPMVSNFFLATRFGAQLIGMTLVFLAAVIFFGYRLFVGQYAQLQQIFQVVDPSLQNELYMNDILVNNMTGIGVSVIAYVAIMVVLIIKANHRYQGPTIPIIRFVDMVGAGDYSQRLTIREGDRLQDLVNTLNAMVEALNRRHGPGVPAAEKDEKIVS